MEYLIGAIAGIILGGILTYVVFRLVYRSTRESNREMEKSFSSLSLDALRKNSEDFLRLATENLSRQSQAGATELEGKKKLIDMTLDSIKENLSRVEKTITEFDKNRASSFEGISQQLKYTAEQTGKLHETTTRLQNALVNSRVRGQWGERMADDILRYVGLVEDINYTKNRVQETADTRPDYTFLLPKNLKVNMDVKFPCDNYMKYCGEENDGLKDNLKQQFLKDARKRIKEVTTRDYINPADNTVDYVLVFIPSEQIYCFMHENDSELIDDALKSKVILCSPLTLYAMLSIIRQAIDNFSFEKTTSEISFHLREFQKQWDAFKQVMENMGKKIDNAREEYRKLVTVRADKLEKPLQQIEEIRKKTYINGTPVLGIANDLEAAETPGDD